MTWAWQGLAGTSMLLSRPQQAGTSSGHDSSAGARKPWEEICSTYCLRSDNKEQRNTSRVIRKLSWASEKGWRRKDTKRGRAATRTRRGGTWRSGCRASGSRWRWTRPPRCRRPCSRRPASRPPASRAGHTAPRCGRGRRTSGPRCCRGRISHPALASVGTEKHNELRMIW